MNRKSTESKQALANSNVRNRIKLGVGLTLIVALGITWYVFRDSLRLERLADYEEQLKSWYADQPYLVMMLAYLVYSLATGVSFPGATVLTLMVGWFFGFWPALLLVSFASTTGATLAFITSRYFFRDAIQERFQSQLTKFNRELDREGAFYLFTLRLIPAVPFFVINLVMGLTRMKVGTYWWVSQLGMLPGTVLYVYAGSQIPDFNTLADEGIQAVFTPAKLTQIIIAFVLLGIFPLATRKAIKWFRPAVKDAVESTDEHAESTDKHAENEQQNT